MISSQDFDHFLKFGFIEGLKGGESMEVLLNRFGKNNWYTNDFYNGVNFGIIKIGFIEFHIAYDKLSGISYRPDISFPMSDFKNVAIPWIFKFRRIEDIEKELVKRGIVFKSYVIKSSIGNFKTAGYDLSFDESKVYNTTFIDTEGCVTLEFESKDGKDYLVVRKVAKHFKIDWK